MAIVEPRTELTSGTKTTLSQEFKMFIPIEWLPPELHGESMHASLQMIGVIGSCTYVCVFFLIQSGRICGNGVLYPILQVFAASCVLSSLTTAFNLAAFIIQFSFILIALYGIWYRVSGRLSGRLERCAAMTQPSQVSDIAHHHGPAGTDAQSAAPSRLDLSPYILQAERGGLSHSGQLSGSDPGGLNARST